MKTFRYNGIETNKFYFYKITTFTNMMCAVSLVLYAQRLNLTYILYVCSYFYTNWHLIFFDNTSIKKKLSF